VATSETGPDLVLMGRERCDQLDQRSLTEPASAESFACAVVGVVGALSVPITLGLGPMLFLSGSTRPKRGDGRQSMRSACISCRRARARRRGARLGCRAVASVAWQRDTSDRRHDGAHCGWHRVAGDGDVFGFDRTTGARKWRFALAQDDAPGRDLGARAVTCADRLAVRACLCHRR
jgi:hypothetical protein